jgi:Fe2+ transport system protein FeoA
VGHPAWSSDGSTIFASVGRSGLVEIQELAVRAGVIENGEPIARSSAALFGPTSQNDQLFFLGMDADGIEIRRLALDASTVPLPELELDSSLAPVTRFVSGTTPPTIEIEPLDDDRPYGMGRLEISPLFGGSWAASGGALEFAGRLGDVLGRTEDAVRVRAGGREWNLDPMSAQNVTVRHLPVGEDAGGPWDTLADARSGETVRVLDISMACQGTQRRRLLDLGVVRGTEITAELVSASGDPVAYRIRGALIALRRDQAKWVQVERAASDDRGVA